MSQSRPYKKPYKKKSKAHYAYKTEKMYLKDKAKNQDRPPGVIHDIGGEIGSMLGGPIPIVGPVVGKFLGGKLGHLVEKITGFGDYQVKNNSILRGGMSPPQVINSMNNGGYIVRHREYICDINASTDFTIQTFPINPGMAVTFPWLSQIAGSFEEYKWRGVLFEAKSLSSDAVLSTATSSALGAVIMATQYNCLSPPFTDKRSMENYEFASSAKPSISQIHPVECSSALTPLTKLYVRNGAIPDNADQRLYDLGEFNIATQGMQSNTGVVCELWVTYEVEFYKNKYNPIDMTDHFDLLNGYSTTQPLGTSPALMNASAVVRGSSLGCTIADSVGLGSNILFPKNVSSGIYLITVTWIGTVSAVLTYPAINCVGCTQLQWWQGDLANSQASPVNGVTSLTACVQYFVKINAQNAYVYFLTGATLPTGTNRVQVVVTQVSTTLTG